MPQPHPVQRIMDADGYETEELLDDDRDDAQRLEERLHDVLEILMHYCRHRGNLDKIKEIIHEHNATNPLNGP